MSGVVRALLVLFVLGCGGGPATPAATDPSGPAEADEPVVDFELRTLGGEPFRLSSLRGRVVLVNLFATWCQPCIAELPALNDLIAGPEPVEGLAVVAVDVETEPEAQLPAFLERVKIDFPVLLADDAILSGDTPFGPVRAIPISFLVDPAGRHVETFVGPTPIDHLRRRVRALLEGE